MAKNKRKLLVFLSVFICLLCLCLCLAACNNDNGDNTGDTGGEHTHTFGGFWLFDGAEGHFRLATCHTEVKSELEPHVDENADFKCDVCGYVMHAHVDEDGDNLCDDCHTEIHKHSFAEEWSFNEVKHWHNANCKHFTERNSYADHVFIQGVCLCGVKESEVKVYGLYKNSPEYELYFPQWLARLKAEGIISVEYTASGDGIYHYENGTKEVRFLGERTVKVKAQSGGEPLSDVWFMVSMYTGSKYYESNGTIALGIAKTDASGIAEIAFNPVGGYSSRRVEYRIRVALAADVAAALGTTEENAKPIPNRYEVSDTNFEYVAYEVNENSNAEDIAATVNFTFSKGWNAYDTIELPYKRYYQDQINGENIKEEGTTYRFTTSGKDLFDYFLFEPAKYSFASGNTVEDFAKIEENAKQAASGIYKIYFTYEGTANVTLYYWNEQGVNMSVSHQTKTDGTPSDEYITSVSGGTAGEHRHTGGNFVNVTIMPATGLRQYQFGIISDTAVKVTITVERVGDFVIRENDPITVGDNDNITLLGNGATAALKLQNVPAGYYYLTVNVTDIFNESDAEVNQKGMFSAYVTKGKETALWDGISQIKGLINIPEGAQTLYITNYYGTDETILMVSANLSPYNGTVVRLGEETSVPISGDWNIKQEIFLDESITSGKYYFELTLPGGANLSGALHSVRVLVGDKDYSLSLPLGTHYSETISAYIDINQGDTLSIFILGYSSAIVNGMLKLTAVNTVSQGEKISTELYGAENYFKRYTFVANQAGTYKLTITQTNEPELYNSLFGYTTLAVLEVTNATTSEIIKDGSAFSDTDPENFTLTATATFELQEGEDIILYFRSYHRNHLNFDFTIEYVEN